MATRNQVAAHVATGLRSDRPAALRLAAAWLIETGRERQAGYLARDIARVLAADGYMYAIVTSARALSDEARSSIETYLREAAGAKTVELEVQIDPGLIGGIRIETPEASLDATVRTKLAKLIERSEA